MTSISKHKFEINLFAVFFTVVALFFPLESAYAACTAPAANVGSLDFQAGVFKYCDGTTWLPLGGSSTTDASLLTSGILADARLSTNVPLKNAANTFTVGAQQITNNAAATIPFIIRAAAAQTATLTHWEDSVGATIYGLAPGGVPIAATDLADKGYVDTSVGNYVLKAGDTMTGPLRASNGTAAAPSLSFANDINTGLYTTAVDDINFATGGTLRVVLDNSALASAFSGGASIRVGAAPALTSPAYAFMGDTNTGIWNPSAEAIGFVTNSTEHVRISSAGNVGIGTTNPARLFEVSKGTSLTTPVARIDNTTGTAGSASVVELSGGANADGSGGYISMMLGGSSAEVMRQGWFRRSASWGVEFQNTSGTSLVRVDSTGNVGIGTTAPGALLHVNGPMRLQPAALPGTPGAGDIAIDSGASNALKYYDGSGWKTVATGNTLTGTTTTNLTFFGIGAGGSQTLAGSTYIGKDSGLNATGASGLGSNTAIGVSTLKSENTGFNVAIGANALTANTTNYNTAVGTNSMSGASSSGNYNAALGATTMTANTTGSYNVAVGVSAMNSNTTGSYNTALGKSALDALNIGGYNTAVGVNAGNIVTSGTYNTIVGTSSAAALTTGTNNIVIGYNANVPASNTGNFMNIGNLIFGTGMTGSIAAPAGNVGIANAGPLAKLDVTGQIRSGVYNAVSAVAINWDNGNNQYTAPAGAACTAMTFTNMLDGGSYTLAVQSVTSGTCTFSQAGLTFVFSPANSGVTSDAVYTFLRMGTKVYVSWTTDFQ